MTDISWLAKRPIAHRGFHDLNKTRWENTLSAFEAAVERDYAIECDVHLSSDGIPIVFHDRELDRLCGREGLLSDLDAAAIAGLRVGGTPDHVPSLAEVLRHVAGRVPLVIELKGSEGKDEGLVAAVAKALEGYQGEAAIMSFEHRFIRDFARQAPGIACGLTAHGRTPADLEAHFSMLAHGIDFVSFHVADLPNRFVDTVRSKLAMPVITWTVREEWAVDVTRKHADQMTFEGFEP
jgi:glycerophosphoryl diester phosphodiesterase